MKNKVNKKRGVKFLRGRAREGRGKFLHLLKETARPRSGQKRVGKKEGGLGEGIFARPLLGFDKIFSEADGSQNKIRIKGIHNLRKYFIF